MLSWKFSFLKTYMLLSVKFTSIDLILLTENGLKIHNQTLLMLLSLNNHGVKQILVTNDKNTSSSPNIVPVCLMLVLLQIVICSTMGHRNQMLPVTLLWFQMHLHQLTYLLLVCLLSKLNLSFYNTIWDPVNTVLWFAFSKEKVRSILSPSD